MELAPLISAVVTFIGIVFLFSTVGNSESRRKRRLLKRMEQESTEGWEEEEELIIPSEAARLRSRFEGVPILESTEAMIRKASFTPGMLGFFGLVIFLTFPVYFGIKPITHGLIAPPLAFCIAFILGRKFLGYLITKRSLKFLSIFPDALDMIVRSVRAGQPLTSALAMIADTIEDPVGGEFRRLADEVAHGRSLTEALANMAHRVQEPDVNFFVVVLTVQQETGGNLAEVLGNLSNIVRKRKQLRMKVHAMTSEGRMTSWILGSLPFVVLGALLWQSPNYLTPLFEDSTGQLFLYIAIGLIITSMVIVRRMVDIEI